MQANQVALTINGTLLPDGSMVITIALGPMSLALKAPPAEIRNVGQSIVRLAEGATKTLVTGQPKKLD